MAGHFEKTRLFCMYFAIIVYVLCVFCSFFRAALIYKRVNSDGNSDYQRHTADGYCRKHEVVENRRVALKKEYEWVSSAVAEGHKVCVTALKGEVQYLCKGRGHKKNGSALWNIDPFWAVEA